MASLFVFHDDLTGMTRLFASPVASVETALLAGARALSGAESEGPALEENAVSPPARALPAPAAEPAALSSREIAALAQAAEEQPERPEMLVASVGESFRICGVFRFFYPRRKKKRRRRSASVHSGRGFDRKCSGNGS